MSGRISLSRKHAQALCVFYERVIHGKGSPFLPYSNEMDAADALRSALTPSPKKRAATKARKAAKDTKRAAHNEETAEIREAVVERAGGYCECGCGRAFYPASPGELDHWHGRVRVAQSVETCWLLTPRCHRRKTDGWPDRRWWLATWRNHCLKHGYEDEVDKANARLASLSDVAEAAALTGGRHV